MCAAARPQIVTVTGTAPCGSREVPLHPPSLFSATVWRGIVAAVVYRVRYVHMCWPVELKLALTCKLLSRTSPFGTIGPDYPRSFVCRSPCSEEVQHTARRE
jgi:hypothetical protein